MGSPVLPFNAAASLLGFLLNCAILYLVLSRGRKTYHYLFAGMLAICALWDLGTFLIVARNGHPEQVLRHTSRRFSLIG